MFFAFAGVPVVIAARFVFLRSNYRDMDQAIPTSVVESNDEEKALLEDFCLQHPALTSDPPFHTCMIMDRQKQHLDALRDSLKDPAPCVDHIYVSDLLLVVPARRRPLLSFFSDIQEGLDIHPAEGKTVDEKLSMTTDAEKVRDRYAVDTGSPADLVVLLSVWPG